MVSDGENHFMKNKCNKWMRYKNILPNHKKYQFESSTIHLVGVDMIKNYKFNINYRNIFLYDIKM